MAAIMANTAVVANLALVLGAALAEVVGLAEMVEGRVAKGVAVRVPGVIALVGMAAKAMVTQFSLIITQGREE